jgi:hypothetical protein
MKLLPGLLESRALQSISFGPPLLGLKHSPLVMVDDHLFKACFPSTIVPCLRAGNFRYRASGVFGMFPLDCSIVYQGVVISDQRRNEVECKRM